MSPRIEDSSVVKGFLKWYVALPLLFSGVGALTAYLSSNDVWQAALAGGLGGLIAGALIDRVMNTLEWFSLFVRTGGGPGAILGGLYGAVVMTVAGENLALIVVGGLVLAFFGALIGMLLDLAWGLRCWIGIVLAWVGFAGAVVSGNAPAPPADGWIGVGLGFVWALAASAAAGAGAELGLRQLLDPSFREPKPYEKWALSAAAHWIWDLEDTWGRVRSLTTIREAKQILDKDWGIDNSRAAMGRVQSLAAGVEGDDLAFDLSRRIQFTRWCERTGYLGRRVVQESMLDAARRLQVAFRSWEEFGEAFCRGFAAWDEDEDDDRPGHEANDWLLENDESPWREISWDTSL